MCYIYIYLVVDIYSIHMQMRIIIFNTMGRQEQWQLPPSSWIGFAMLIATLMCLSLSLAPSIHVPKRQSGLILTHAPVLCGTVLRCLKLMTSSTLCLDKLFNTLHNLREKAMGISTPTCLYPEHINEYQ